MGRSMWHLGIYDLVLSESLWRLIAPGEACADVGSNIGYTACLMAARSGSGGKVVAFEPHPHLREELAANVARWRGLAAPVEQLASAASDHAGKGRLRIPDRFSENSG